MAVSELQSPATNPEAAMPSSCKAKSQSAAAEKAVFLSDVHVPYHDDTTLGVVNDFLKWFRPDHLFLVGDILDFYQLSRFSKDPSRALELQDDIDAAQFVLRDLRKSVGQDCKVYYLDGNHEHRLLRYLWDHPEVASLKALSISALLGLQELNISHHRYGETVFWHGLLVEHGDRVRSKSGGTAAAMLESRGRSGISGHSHRLSAHFKTDHNGVLAWYENGCLCRLDPEYVIGVPNWQQGFTVGSALDRGDRWILEQVPIIKHRLFFSGRLWVPKVK